MLTRPKLGFLPYCYNLSFEFDLSVNLKSGQTWSFTNSRNKEVLNGIPSQNMWSTETEFSGEPQRGRRYPGDRVPPQQHSGAGGWAQRNGLPLPRWREDQPQDPDGQRSELSHRVCPLLGRRPGVPGGVAAPPPPLCLRHDGGQDWEGALESGRGGGCHQQPSVWGVAGWSAVSCVRPSRHNTPPFSQVHSEWYRYHHPQSSCEIIILVLCCGPSLCYLGWRI